MDHKTGAAETMGARYAGQLGAYAFALQNPANDARYTAMAVARPRYSFSPDGVRR